MVAASFTFLQVELIIIFGVAALLAHILFGIDIKSRLIEIASSTFIVSSFINFGDGTRLEVSIRYKMTIFEIL